MLELSYVLLSVFMLLIILLGYYTALTDSIGNKQLIKKKMLTFVLVFASWFAYLVFLSKSEILFDLNIPPKFPLLVLLPLFLSGVWLYVKQRNNPAIHALPLSWTTYYQTFRVLVEFLLLYTFYKGILPKEATFEGLNFDIVIGLTAPIMGYWMVNNLNKYKKIVYVWNILGIVMLLFVFFIIGTSFYFPEIWGQSLPMTKNTFVTLPYLLIAGFLAPSAIFVHIVSLIQLRKK